MGGMKRWAPIVALAFFGGLAVLKIYETPARATPLWPYDDARIVDQGQALYADYCAACHGASLEGEPNWRQQKPDGRMPAPPHDRTGHTWHHAESQLFTITKYGISALVGSSYASDMPGFEGVLSDEEITAVLSFIKASWPQSIRDRHDRISQ